MKKILINLAAVGFLACAVAGSAQDSGPGDKPLVKREVSSSAVKELEGTISAISATGIAVVFVKDNAKGSEDEIYVPFDKDKIRLVHKRDLKELDVGDTVKVAFKEVTDEEEGKESKRFEATTITFLKKAKKKPEPVILGEPPEESAEEQPENLQDIPLKGMKEE